MASEGLGSPYTARQVPDEELQRLGIVKGGDGRYYKASDGVGGSIVLRPVDPNIAVAAAKTGLDISSVRARVNNSLASISASD